MAKIRSNRFLAIIDKWRGVIIIVAGFVLLVDAPHLDTSFGELIAGIGITVLALIAYMEYQKRQRKK